FNPHTGVMKTRWVRLFPSSRACLSGRQACLGMLALLAALATPALAVNVYRLGAYAVPLATDSTPDFTSYNNPAKPDDFLDFFVNHPPKDTATCSSGGNSLTCPSESSRIISTPVTYLGLTTPVD